MLRLMVNGVKSTPVAKLYPSIIVSWLIDFCFIDLNTFVISCTPWRQCWMIVLVVLCGLLPEGREFLEMESMLGLNTKVVPRSEQF